MNKMLVRKVKCPVRLPVYLTEALVLAQMKQNVLWLLEIKQLHKQKLGLRLTSPLEAAQRPRHR